MNAAASSPDERFDTLAELLDVHAAFDIEGLLGLLHAVAVAPSLVMPSTWFHRILSEEGEPGVLRPPKHGAPPLDATTFNDLTTLITGLYNEVLHCIRQDGVLIPRADDVDGCESFAEGYIAGAQLVPEWIGNEACWNLVGPFAYLADQLDLVPRDLIAGIEEDFGPDPKQGIRECMCDLVLDTNDAFDEYRRIHPAHAYPSAGPRIGRNDPCPCGSGKKYKKCCATRAASPP